MAVAGAVLKACGGEGSDINAGRRHRVGKCPWPNLGYGSIGCECVYISGSNKGGIALQPEVLIQYKVEVIRGDGRVFMHIAIIFL